MKSRLVITLATLAVCLLPFQEICAQGKGKKGGGGSGDGGGGSSEPQVLYELTWLTTPSDLQVNDFSVWDINNNGVLVGHMKDGDEIYTALVGTCTLGERTLHLD